MATEVFPNVRLSSSLKKHAVRQSIVDEIADRFLAGISNLEKIRTDGQMLSLVKDICVVLENRCPKNNRTGLQLDKKQMAIDILKRIFKDSDLSPAELLQVNSNINFIVESGLKRVKKWRRFRRWFLSLFCSSYQDHFLGGTGK